MAPKDGPPSPRRRDSTGYQYTNSLAAVHTVLKRLNRSQEVLFVEHPSGKFACEWRPSVRPVLLSETALAAHLTSHAKPEPKRKSRRKQ